MKWWRIGWAGLVSDVRSVGSGLAWLFGVGRRRELASWWRRCTWLVLAAVACLLGPAASAQADVIELGVLGVLTDAHDGHFIYLHYFQLHINRGGLTDWWNGIFGALVWIGWEFYRLAMGMSLWLLDLVVGFSWLEMLRAPAGVIAGVLNEVVNGLGIVAVLGVLSVVISGFWLLRGRTGTGAGEIMITFVVVSLMGTVLTNPVEMIAGEEGAISTARDMGVTLTQEVLDDGSGQSVEPSERIMAALVRTPHQFINFGASLDRRSEECSEAYDEFMLSLEEVSVDTLADPCGQDVVTAAENPSQALLPMMVVMPAATGLGWFFIVLLTGLVLITMFVVWQAAKFIWEMLKAILPGSRQGLFNTLATMAVGLAMLVFGLLAVAGFVLLIDAVFNQTDGWDPVIIFAFLDLMMFVALIGLAVFLIRGFKQRKTVGAKVNTAMSAKPASMNSGPNAMAMAARGAAMSKAALGGAALGRRSGKKAGEAATSTEGTAGQETSKPKVTLRRVAAGTAKGAWKSTKFAAAATVGAPVAAPKAAAAAKTALAARKSALGAKLAASKAKAGQVRDQVTNYGKEYAHNVGVAGKFAGQVTGATAAAQGAGQVGKWAVSKGAAPAAAGAMIAATTTGPAAAASTVPPHRHYSVYDDTDEPSSAEEQPAQHREAPVEGKPGQGPSSIVPNRAQGRGGQRPTATTEDPAPSAGDRRTGDGQPSPARQKVKLPRPGPDPASETSPASGSRTPETKSSAATRTPPPKSGRQVLAPPEPRPATTDPAVPPLLDPPVVTNRQRLEARLERMRAQQGSALSRPVQMRRK